MKKLLLTSAALVAMVSSNAVFADTNVSAGSAAWRPALKISGAASFSSHFHKSEKKDPNGGKGRGTHFALEDSSINFDVCGKADSFAGLEYSWLVTLDGDKSKAFESNISTNRFKFKNDYGTFMAGNMNGVEDGGRGAHKVMGATGGFDGNYKNTINRSTGTRNISTTDLVGRTKKATKIAYYTPRLWGLQLGASYAPDQKHLGEGKLRSHTSGAFATNRDVLQGESFSQNLWSGIVDFSHKLPYGFGINLSLTGLIGKTHAGIQNGMSQNLHENACGWAVGGDINYTWGDHIFTVGSEYVDNRKSGMAKRLRVGAGNNNVLQFGGGDAGYVWATAASYEVGSHKIAYGYLRGRRDLGGVRFVNQSNNDIVSLGCAKSDVHSVTYDKKMAPGWGLYAEFNHFRFKTSDAMAKLQDEVKNSGRTPGNSILGQVINPGSYVNQSALLDGVGNNCGHSVIVGTKIKF